MKDRKTLFIKLAEARVNRALKLLQLIGNLADQSNYIYTNEQSEKIIGELQKAVDTVKLQFQNRSKETDLFRLAE